MSRVGVARGRPVSATEAHTGGRDHETRLRAYKACPATKGQPAQILPQSVPCVRGGASRQGGGRRQQSTLPTGGRHFEQPVKTIFCFLGAVAVMGAALMGAGRGALWLQNVTGWGGNHRRGLTPSILHISRLRESEACFVRQFRTALTVCSGNLPLGTMLPVPTAFSTSATGVTVGVRARSSHVSFGKFDEPALKKNFWGAG